MQEEIDAIDAVSRVIDRITRKGRFAELTLVNGIVLGLKPVPPLLLSAVMGEFPDPEPPIVYIEEKGREEPHPNDPQYVKQLDENNDRRSLALSDLVLAAGSHFISAPDGYFGPDEDGWVATIEFANKLAGIDIKIDQEDKIKRYLQWLRFYALESQIDIAIVQSLHHQLAGIREGEVEEVLASFQRDEGRRTDSAGDAASGSANGNQPNRASRRSRPRG